MCIYNDLPLHNIFYMFMFEIFKNITFLTFAFLAISCIDGPLKLSISESMVVSHPDSSDVLLTYFVKKNAFTALFYVNGDCSPCLIELNGWKHFFENYPILTPLLVVRTEHPDTFPIFLEMNDFNFPTVYDYELSFWTKNHFTIEAPLIILNSDSGILYVGKPECDTSFAKKYNMWYNEYFNK